MKVTAPLARALPSGIQPVPQVGETVSILVMAYPVLASLPKLSRTITVHDVLPEKIVEAQDCRVVPLSKL